ncbi:MAG: hypothetical protein A2Y45_06455 [Tenericutes bacterium GWC2_34_14]|nr:MAG: hypothetical protein A2Z84_03400 [Tenericutes bacterium GWA2_35_7]OHE28595.1 MAG: hypothetical protein A2Y45_06455 [Tenericutes bacterium GWC2_34_14]OHE33497.1 MAG: hypothetical protein A2012_03355 [Tenericutes bacterium GWE2_34_108]OHE36782.1 MAG: hypothetical protein A2Y46_09155 [Tenericutes bacterium GWF1_35_14]OHE38138.1 MAG: hypothetical protein A2Y44_09510 [Tenericutes bacterium GWF2_35_184]OHE43345.1 MAG: hypothetical protein A2221_06225 [Tenericutes bacterium RIFOXYA2_FULL_36_3
MRTRDHHKVRGITLIVLSIVALIGFPIMSFFVENMTLGQGIGMGLFSGLLFFIIGFINYSMYKSDLDIEKAKDDRIKDLERELKKHEDKRFD